MNRGLFGHANNMRAIEIAEAEAALSEIMDALETGAEREIILAREGKPAAKLVPFQAPPMIVEES